MPFLRTPSFYRKLRWLLLSEKYVLKTFGNFARTYLCWKYQFSFWIELQVGSEKVSLSFTKFTRTTILKSTSKQLLLKLFSGRNFTDIWFSFFSIINLNYTNVKKDLTFALRTIKIQYLVILKESKELMSSISYLLFSALLTHYLLLPALKVNQRIRINCNKLIKICVVTCPIV